MLKVAYTYFLWVLLGSLVCNITLSWRRFAAFNGNALFYDLGAVSKRKPPSQRFLVWAFIKIACEAAPRTFRRETYGQWRTWSLPLCVFLLPVLFEMQSFGPSLVRLMSPATGRYLTMKRDGTLRGLVSEVILSLKLGTDVTRVTFNKA